MRTLGMKWLIGQYHHRSKHSGGKIASWLSAVLMVGFSSEPGLAASMESIAGVVERVPDASVQLASHFLRSARTGEIVAGLLDPKHLISQTPARVVLQSKRLARPDVNGLPLFSVIDIVPEFWVQPASYGLLEKGPGTFAEVSGGIIPKDWTGMPLEDLRTSRLDNGLDGELPVALSGGFDPSTAKPLDLTNVQFDGRSLHLGWQGVAGLIYQLLYATDPQGPYSVLREVAANETGEVDVSVNTSGLRGFFKLAVTQPSD